MMKFLPGLFVFAIVFFATIAIQIGAATLSSSNKEKIKTGNELYEEIYKNLAVETIEKKHIKLSKIESPVVILNFWASWCGPCLSEMPSLGAMKKKFKSNDITIISFNTDERDQLKNIKSTMSKFNFAKEFEIVADKDTKIADSFKFSAIPVSIVFSHGKVVHFSNGPIDFESQEFIEKLKKLIN